jgi:large repetitive protein
MSISFTSGSAASSASAVSSLALPSFNLTAGQGVIVGITLGSTSSSVSGITDTKGNSYSLIASVNGTGVRTELWKSLSVGAQTSNVITVNISGATSVSAQAAQYAGVSALGASATNSGSNFIPQQRESTTQGNNWIVGELGFVTAASTTQTALAGNSREVSIAASSVGGSLYDSTCAGDANLLLQNQLNSSQNWASVSVELQTGGASVTFNSYASVLSASIQSGLLLPNSTAWFLLTSVEGPPGFVIFPNAPIPVAANLAGGLTGLAYTETISAKGGISPYTFSLSVGALPAGTSLTGSTGVIAGTPSTAGTFNFTIKATDSTGASGTQNFQIIIAAPSAGGGSFTFLG